MGLWRRSWWKRAPGLLAAGLALGLLADGALVGAQGGGNVIYACVFDNPTGPNTRIVPETELPCPERSVLESWSIQGPAGPTGPAGPAGTGLAYGASKAAQQQIAPGKSVVLTLPLPKGKYLVSAKAAIQGNNFACTLVRVGQPKALDESFGGSEVNLAATVSLQRLHSLPAGGKVRLRCVNQANKLTFVYQRRISAIQLDGYLHLGS